MIFFSSPLERATDRLIKARFKLSEAARRGEDTEAAQRDLEMAEAIWHAVCDGMSSRSRFAPKLYQQGATMSQTKSLS